MKSNIKTVILELAQDNSFSLSDQELSALQDEIIFLFQSINQIKKIKTDHCPPFQFPHLNHRFNYLRSDQAISTINLNYFRHNAPVLEENFVFLPKITPHEL